MMRSAPRHKWVADQAGIAHSSPASSFDRRAGRRRSALPVYRLPLQLSRPPPPARSFFPSPSNPERCEADARSRRPECSGRRFRRSKQVPGERFGGVFWGDVRRELQDSEVGHQAGTLGGAPVLVSGMGRRPEAEITPLGRRRSRAAEHGNGEAAADLLRQVVRDFRVARNGFDLSGARVDPQRVGSSFAFEMAAVAA